MPRLTSLNSQGNRQVTFYLREEIEEGAGAAKTTLNILGVGPREEYKKLMVEV